MLDKETIQINEMMLKCLRRQSFNATTPYSKELCVDTISLRTGTSIEHAKEFIDYVDTLAKTVLLQSLKDLKFNANILKPGICYNASVHVCINFKKLKSVKYGLGENLVNRIASEIMSNLFTEWEFYSGNPLYPVPRRKDLAKNLAEGEEAINLAYTDAEQAYDGVFWAPGTDHRWEGEYGRLRIELLDFLIESLEKLC
ncbi:hypothetical protein KNT64_gp203 [Pseudomonas phage PspYZU05]|uniref:Uncharacterized protein n=1 Tax=Pseudomonas phage PspYZU05 TaxID=1983556 RepID=A0A2U7N2T5_9CAUD|nr:hypothetical protein KNT64_gp203 [Pseudomonas phage PspYZU05]ASD52155.1 hypothetical protein PspYZU05_203 [Pseudomonas phage PspYZU05]